MMSDQVEVPVSRTSEEIRVWLVERIAMDLHVPASTVDVHRQFGELGVPSIEAACLSGDLSRWLGRNVNPLVLWDYPSIEQLARYLSGETTAPNS